MLTLFRKELKDFFNNYKTWLFFLIMLVLTYIFKFLSRELDPEFFICFILMCVCQYLYDSYLTDTTSKGSIFLHNIDMRFFQVFVVKILFTLFQALVIVLVNITYVVQHFSLADILWFLPLAVGIAAIMQLAMVFARGAEIASALITTCIIFAGVFLLLTLSTLMRAGVTMAAAIILVRLAYCSFNSLRYRTQL